jgi:NADH-quinone oxidoreductase subunit C
MTQEEILQQFTTSLSTDLALTTAEVGDSCIYIPPTLWVKACLIAKENNSLKFDFLRSLCATDYLDDKQIEVAIHLFSYAYKHAITLKCRLDREKPVVDSIHLVWPAANWHEREAWELLGVHFTDHPNLKFLLLPEDWVGYPLRKDYKQEEFYKGVPTTPAEFDFDNECGTASQPQPKDAA